MAAGSEVTKSESPTVETMASSASEGAGAPDDDVITSFVSEIPAKEVIDLNFQLQSFVVRHASHHRPVALVTSGGTAADLEVNSVRCLDNFSTGLRGAISVEEFLKRGYAVIHLTRKGSASPYGRVLSQVLGITQANHGLSVEGLGKLFAGSNPDDSHEDELVQAVLRDDPWLTEPKSHEDGAKQNVATDDGAIKLHRRMVNYHPLQKALRERSAVLSEGRLLTVPFRTLEEYLGKLQLIAEALRDSQSLAVLYLAAAVSDFYVPSKFKSEHKIQSQDGGLTLQLHPVPKMMRILRKSWAPDAFVVSFKLETDKSILRQKAERAVEKYGVHMVIGNLLQSRHERVWVLYPPPDNNGSDVSDWPLREISRPKSSEADALEEALMDFVVEQHFDYISQHWNGQTSHLSGTEAAIRTHELLQEKKQRVESEIFWKRFRNGALQLSGSAVGALLTYAISSFLQKGILRQKLGR